jgi:hypothetical protein
MTKKKPSDEDLAFLRSIGKCASVDQDGYICTLSENHFGRMHKAQIMGGIDDGKVLAQWPW